MLFLKKLNFFRSIKFLKYKIFRIRDLPESIAIGLAWGAAVSFTPLLGFHILICFLGTFLMRGNLLAAAAGTIVGNPWTFPIIYFIGFEIGSLLYEPDIDFFELKISFFLRNFEQLFIPTLIGSVPLAVIAWFITYKISKFVLYEKIKWKNKL
jgi:uncharacterized protein (DUF2062 family)